MGDHWSKTFEFLQHPFFEWLLSFAWVQCLCEYVYTPAVQTWGFWPTMSGAISVIIVVIASGWAVIKYIGRQYKTNERYFFMFWKNKITKKSNDNDNQTDATSGNNNTPEDNSTDNSTNIDTGDNSSVTHEQNESKVMVGDVGQGSTALGNVTGNVIINNYHGSQNQNTQNEDNENNDSEEGDDEEFLKACNRVKLNGGQIFTMVNDADGHISVEDLKQALGATKDEVPPSCVGKSESDYHAWFTCLLQQLNTRGETSIYELVSILSGKPFKKEFAIEWKAKIEKTANSKNK